jgi:1-acyl-sn-glycerol-3-phosphate acyltransferase
MIDKDGIERPDKLDEHILEIKNEKRKVKFDGNYSFRPRNIFFRAWCAFFRGLAIIFFNPFMKLRYNMWTFGAHNAKKLKGKPFIITCNHVHFFDDISIGTNLFCWRKIYFTTLENNIRRPMIGFFLRSLGGIPIPTQSLSGTKKFNDDISSLLSKNKPILYNPEGALWPNYREIRPYKRGAFSMAVKNDVPILPLVLLFKRKQKRNGKFKYYLYFAMCDPIEIDKSLPDERSQSTKLMEETYAVTTRVAREWYEIQDCGFGDEKVKRKLRPSKDLTFKNNQWIIKEHPKKK